MTCQLRIEVPREHDCIAVWEGVDRGRNKVRWIMRT